MKTLSLSLRRLRAFDRGGWRTGFTRAGHKPGAKAGRVPISRDPPHRSEGTRRLTFGYGFRLIGTRPTLTSGLSRLEAARGFTLVELLVVLAVVVLLGTSQWPALSRAKPKSQMARCASNMRAWGMATLMYLAENGDALPYYADTSPEDPSSPWWFSKLAPYVARTAQPGDTFGSSWPFPLSSTDIVTNNVSKCPGGSFSAPPLLSGTWPSNTWNCWIGVHFGGTGSPLSGPFYYGSPGTLPLRVARVRKPAEGLTFMDTVARYVYSPANVNYRFALDLNGDGKVDTMPQYPTVAFNYARPTVHNGGANVTLMDGHVEWVSFDKLWQVDSSSNVVHSFWHLE